MDFKCHVSLSVYHRRARVIYDFDRCLFKCISVNRTMWSYPQQSGCFLPSCLIWYKRSDELKITLCKPDKHNHNTSETGRYLQGIV